MLSPLTLLRLHIEAVWYVRLPLQLTHDVELLQEGFQPPWKLSVAELAEDRVYIWRPDVSPAEREALRQRVEEALTFPPLETPLSDVSREVALSQIAIPRMDLETAQHIARPLRPSDHALLEVFNGGDPDEYFQQAQQPLIGVVQEGRLLSLAHSSRRTAEACELGIETLPDTRRRGFALAATIVWAEMIRQEGRVPLYSAFAENAASLRLAQAAGYRPFARVASFKE